MITCIATSANGGTFSVINPEGYQLIDAEVGSDYHSTIGFTIEAGDIDFAIGDQFTIQVASFSGDYTLATKSAVDGSQVVRAILATDTDTSTEAKNAPIYVEGSFNENAIIFGGEDTADDHRQEMRNHRLLLHTVIGG